jgi:hypothetical protein
VFNSGTGGYPHLPKGSFGRIQSPIQCRIDLLRSVGPERPPVDVILYKFFDCLAVWTAQHGEASRQSLIHHKSPSFFKRREYENPDP